MITKFLGRAVGELICAKDGSVSLTRLAATTAHGSAAFFFIWHNLHTGFSAELWGLYLGITVLHAGYDKTLMVNKGAADAKPTSSD